MIAVATSSWTDQRGSKTLKDLKERTVQTILLTSCGFYEAAEKVNLSPARDG